MKDYDRMRNNNLIVLDGTIFSVTRILTNYTNDAWLGRSSNYISRPAPPRSPFPKHQNSHQIKTRVDKIAMIHSL